MNYLFKLEEDYTHPVVIDSPDFSSRWLDIEDGVLTVKSGYAWDGCTPCCSVLGLFTINTPNGHLSGNRPITYYASLVHDALYQYRGKHSLSKEDADLMFLQDLEAREFKPAKVYYWFVKKFGTSKGWAS